MAFANIIRVPNSEDAEKGSGNLSGLTASAIERRSAQVIAQVCPGFDGYRGEVLGESVAKGLSCLAIPDRKAGLHGSYHQYIDITLECCSMSVFTASANGTYLTAF